MNNKVTVRISGNEYTLITNENEERVLRLAEEINVDMREILQSSNKVSFTDAAVLTAFEYLNQYKKSDSNTDNMRSQIKDYLEEISKVNVRLVDLKKENDELRQEIRNLKNRLSAGYNRG